MRELIALHERIRALPEEQRYICGVDWFGDASTWREAGVDEAAVGSLPEELQAEFRVLTSTIIAAMAEGFIFRAFVGYGEEDARCPRFRLFSQKGGKSGDSLKGDFVWERSLIEQLRELSWEEQHVKAIEHKQNIEAVVDVLEQMPEPTSHAKLSSLSLGKELKHFFRYARADVSRIHVLYREKGQGYTQVSFDTVDELRTMLPGIVPRSEYLISLVAWDTIFSSYFFEGLRKYGRKFAMIGLNIE